MLYAAKAKVSHICHTCTNKFNSSENANKRSDLLRKLTMLSTVEVSSTTGFAVTEDVSKGRVDVAFSPDVVVKSLLWLLFVGVVSLCTIGVAVVVSRCVTGVVVVVGGRVTTSAPHFTTNLPVARRGQRTNVSCHTRSYSTIRNMFLQYIVKLFCHNSLFTALSYNRTISEVHQQLEKYSKQKNAKYNVF